MKVFISHTFSDDDQELAIKLQKILDKKGIDGYLAEKKKEYDLLIRDKIRNEIENSDHMIAIVTNKARESASVNQELGYALREGIRPIIMLEEKAKVGVLTHGIEPEEFTRENFELHCYNIIDFIFNKGLRKKITEEELKELIENVYEPCYDQIMNVYEKRDSLNEIPRNPWNYDISPRWKLRTEPEMKELFDEYTTISEIWKKMFTERENEYNYNQSKLGELIKPAFEQAGLINSDSIQLDPRSSMQVKDWFHAFRFILLDPTITDASILYEKLLDYARRTNNGHEKWLERFNAKTDLFRNIVNLMPEIIDKFHPEIPEEQLVSQRQKLKEIIEKLKIALEEKLK